MKQEEATLCLPLRVVVSVSAYFFFLSLPKPWLLRFGGGNVNESFPLRLHCLFSGSFISWAFNYLLRLSYSQKCFAFNSLNTRLVRFIVSNKKRPDVRWAQARKESYSEYFGWSSLYMPASTASVESATHGILTTRHSWRVCISFAFKCKNYGLLHQRRMIQVAAPVKQTLGVWVSGRNLNLVFAPYVWTTSWLTVRLQTR